MLVSCNSVLLPIERMCRKLTGHHSPTSKESTDIAYATDVYSSSKSGMAAISSDSDFGPEGKKQQEIADWEYERVVSKEAMKRHSCLAAGI